MSFFSFLTSVLILKAPDRPNFRRPYKMEVVDHESQGHWIMAPKLTVLADARAYFKAPGPLGENNSPAAYEIGNLEKQTCKVEVSINPLTTV